MQSCHQFTHRLNPRLMSQILHCHSSEHSKQFTVLDAYFEKHPTKHNHIILKDNTAPPTLHPKIIFDSTVASTIKVAALLTDGSAGPSGLMQEDEPEHHNYW